MKIQYNLIKDIYKTLNNVTNYAFDWKNDCSALKDDEKLKIIKDWREQLKEDLNRLEKLPYFTKNFEDFFFKIYPLFKEEILKGTFHKRPTRKKIFTQINVLNNTFDSTYLNKTGEEVGENFIYLLVFYVLYREAFFLKNDNSMIDSWYKETSFISEKIDLNACNDRNKLIQKVETSLEGYFIAISNIFKIHLNLENLNEWITVIVLFLEEKSVLIANDFEKKIIKLSKNTYIFSTKYVFKYSYENLNEEDIESYYKLNLDLFFSKNKILIFENLYYSSGKTTKHKNFLSSENLFKSKELIKENPNYRKIEEFGNLNSYRIKNKDCNSVFFKDKEIFKESVEKIKNTKRYIDWPLFRKIVETYMLDKIKKFNLTLESPYSEFHKILINYSYVESNENRNDLKIVLELLYLKIFFEKFKDVDFFYALFFFDFRGRLYFTSLIYITNFKLSRFYTFYGYYSEDVIKKIVEDSIKTKSFEALKPLFPIVEDVQKNENIFNCDYFSTDSIDLEFKKSILISEIISLGVIFKNQLLKKDVYTINMVQFLDLGLEKIKMYKESPENLLNNLDQEDKIKTILYIDRIFNKQNWFKIIKSSFDSSCSGHQLRNYINTYSNLEDYRFINLAGEDSFTDYYSFIINKFIKYKKTNEEWNSNSLLSGEFEILEKLFKRSFFKKSLMTVDYNCSFLTFLEYVKINVEEKDSKLFINFFTKSKKSKTMALLKEFYDYCKFDSFDNNSSNLEIIFKGLTISHFQIMYIDGFESSFAFFNKLKADRRITYYSKTHKNKNNSAFKRFTKPVDVFSKKYCPKSSLDKLMPHFIHGCDGMLVRRVTIMSPFFYAYETIHDEYWVPRLEQLLFKDLMNNVFKYKLFIENDSSLENFFNKTNVLNGLYSYFVIL